MSVDLNALGKGIHRHIQEQDFQFGVEAERERIVKLLEPLFDTAENAETRRLLTMAIALIKGENK